MVTWKMPIAWYQSVQTVDLGNDVSSLACNDRRCLRVEEPRESRHTPMAS
jgi:hypothetical protein